MSRILTSLVLVPTALYLILLAPRWAVMAAVATFALLCYREMASIIAGNGLDKPAAWTYLAGLAFALLPTQGFYLAVVAALLILSLRLTAGEFGSALPSAGSVLFAMVYIFGSWKCALPLRDASPWWLLYALSINWVGDASAYYAGRAFGKHKLAPAISPGKSWEGAIASVLTAAVFGAIYLPRLIPSMQVLPAIGLSLVANAAGQVGDLAESALKRGAQMKDSGSLLPGHGGMLDRMDSSLFTMPVVLLYLEWLGRP